jgi:AcrR family transcriptional regulator
MAASRGPALRPRKRPVQARSQATVAALHEASIQVLLKVGYRRFTTTRVAERAGVSVGTLYQYFPNREALVVFVIERYLDELVSAIETDCRPLAGASLEAIAAGLVDAFIAAKWRRLEVSRAMHEPLADIAGAPLVRAAAERTARLVVRLLRGCRDAAFRDEHVLALLIVLACSSLLQAAVADPKQVLGVHSLRAHMTALVLGYLRERRRPTSAGLRSATSRSTSRSGGAAP